MVMFLGIANCAAGDVPTYVLNWLQPQVHYGAPPNHYAYNKNEQTKI